MLRIGDFARLGGVTVRALRHYEAEGLLASAQVDEATGYRSYRFEQLAALDRILALRDLGFSLAEIRDLVSVGGWSKTWFEHMIDLERRRLALSGTEPGRIDAAMKQLAEFHAAYLFDRLTPAQVVERRPHLKGVWYDEPDSQYGRPARFYQQLQELDLAAAWSKVHVPTLVVWGEYDWIMDRGDQEQIVRLVGASARLLVVPRADHSFSQHADATTAFRNMGRGEYPAAAAEEILAFVRSR